MAWFDADHSFGRWTSMHAMRADAGTVLANAYLAVNRPSEAVEHARAAQAVLESLPPSNPVIVTTLSARVIEGQGRFALGHYDDALTAFDHVIAGFEASGLPASGLPVLADAAFMSAVCLQELGRPEPAVQRSRLAERLWRDGAPSIPVRVATNLVVQAMALLLLGEVDEAYRVSAEAVTVARSVHVVPSLVSALRVHGHCMTALGLLAEAEPLFEEALTVAATARPGEVPPIELGLIHNGLGTCRAALGLLDAALEPLLAAAGILREHPGQVPVLAGALITAARCHRELGDNRAGLPLVTEAADRCRDLIVDEATAAALADPFTAALWEVVVVQDTEGDTVAADTAAVEGIGFFRTWGLDRRDEVTEATLHYADLLGYRAAALIEDGRDGEALPLGAEATGILRNLVGLDPDAFRPAYLNSLSGQAELLHRLGQHAEAGAAEQEYARWAPR